jgi:hypothetical protein
MNPFGLFPLSFNKKIISLIEFRESITGAIGSVTSQTQMLENTEDATQYPLGSFKCNRWCSCENLLMPTDVLPFQ